MYPHLPQNTQQQQSQPKGFIPNKTTFSNIDDPFNELVKEQSHPTHVS